MDSPTESRLPKPNITAREWWLVGVITFLAVGWSLVPTLTGVRQTPPDHQYLYTNIPDVIDSQVYYSNIDQNAQGRILYRNLFTSEPHRPVFFNPVWVVLGGLARLTGWSAPVVFTIGRVIGSTLLLVTIYWFTSHFFDQIRWRRLGWLVAVFGGGLGGLALTALNPGHRFIYLLTQPDILKHFPADVTSAAGFPWLMTGHAPHIIVSLVLVLAALIFVWRQRPLWQPGLCILALGFIHPYDLALVAGIVCIHTVIILGRNDVDDVRRQLQRLARLALWTIPVIIFYATLLLYEPAVRAYYRQNFLLAVSPIQLVAGYGLIGPLAIYGLRQLRGTADRRWTMIMAWAIGGLVLYYLPLFRFQAKMLNGYAVPLAILAVIGLRALWPKLQAIPLGRPVAAVGLVLTTFSSMIIFPLHGIASQRHEPRYHYVSSDLLQALEWVKQATPESSVILGDVHSGNLVPHFANRATWLGHNVQTINFPDNLALVRQWFYGTAGRVAAKTEFLQARHITHVIWGPNEKNRGPFDPDEISVLEQVFKNATITIFQVSSRR